MTCSSVIVRHLRSHGRLLAPVFNSPHFVAPEVVPRSITQFQRDLRIPIRLAAFVGITEQWPALDWASPREVAPPEQLARELLGPGGYARALGCVQAASALRPREPALIYGQRYATAPSAVCRAAIVHTRLRTPNPRVLFLGDDDLASIALGAIRPDAQITVVDIDTQVLDALRKISDTLGLKLDLAVRDLFSRSDEPLPAVFDCFVADPYPTGDASFEVAFVRAGFNALGNSQEAFGLVTFAPSHKHERFGAVLLNRLRQLGSVVRETIWDAVEYDTIEGEFTIPEAEYLRLALQGGRGLSHQKSYVVLASGPWVEEVSFDVGGWLEALRQHELSVRLGGEKRLDAELSKAKSAEWRKGVLHGSKHAISTDVVPLFADLCGSVVAAVSCRDLLANGALDDLRESLQAKLRDPLSIPEVEALWRATHIGATTHYETPGQEWELFSLARLYESYSRGYSAEDWSRAS